MGFRIWNTENVQDKVVGISFRRCDQLKPDVVWGVLCQVVRSNARFGLTDHLGHVRIPAANGREKKKGRTLDVMSAIKKNNVVKAAFLSLTNALFIAMARVNGDAKYVSYRNGMSLKNPFEKLLNISGVIVRNTAGH